MPKEKTVKKYCVINKNGINRNYFDLAVAAELHARDLMKRNPAVSEFMVVEVVYVVKRVAYPITTTRPTKSDFE